MLKIGLPGLRRASSRAAAALCLCRPVCKMCCRWSGVMGFPKSRRVSSGYWFLFFSHQAAIFSGSGQGRFSSGSRATFVSCGSSLGPASKPSGQVPSSCSPLMSRPVMKLKDCAAMRAKAGIFICLTSHGISAGSPMMPTPMTASRCESAFLASSPCSACASFKFIFRAETWRASSRKGLVSSRMMALKCSRLVVSPSRREDQAA